MFMCKRIKFWLCKLLYSHRKKSCCISFSSKGFKVITLYRIFEGCQVEDKPIIFLPATASEEELANAIFFCLGKSSMVIRTSINSTSAYLKFIKERSLKSYYQQSVACIVKLNVQTGIIHLELWQQADDGRGMTPCHEQSLMAFDVKDNSQLLAKYVKEILSERLALKKDIAMVRRRSRTPYRRHRCLRNALYRLREVPTARFISNCYWWSKKIANFCRK